MKASEINTIWRNIKKVYEKHFGQEFGSDYLKTKAETCSMGKIHVIYSNKDPVGIIIFLSYEVILNKQKIAVYRLSTAIDKEYRNKRNVVDFIFPILVSDLLKSPFSRRYFVDGVLHVSSFNLVYKNAYYAYPSIKGNTPSEITDLLEVLKKHLLFSSYQFRFKNPFLFEVDCNTSQTKQEELAWREKMDKDEYGQYFYHSGAMEKNRCLLCFIPITFKNVLFSKIKMMKKRRENSLKKSPDLRSRTL